MKLKVADLVLQSKDGNILKCKFSPNGYGRMTIKSDCETIHRDFKCAYPRSKNVKSVIEYESCLINDIKTYIKYYLLKYEVLLLSFDQEAIKNCYNLYN